jgi:hypothetical protein
MRLDLAQMLAFRAMLAHQMLPLSTDPINYWNGALAEHDRRVWLSIADRAIRIMDEWEGR